MKLAILVPIAYSPSVETEVRQIIEPLRDDEEVEVFFVDNGLRQIETIYDDVYTAPLVVKKCIEIWRKGFDGILIDCFDDPGLEAAREVVPIPILGAGIAALSLATSIGYRVAIITVGGRGSLYAVQQRIASYGLEHKVALIKALDIHVVDIKTQSKEVVEQLFEFCKQVYSEGVDVVVLGCTGFSKITHDLIQRLRKENIELKIVDPLISGYLMLKTLVKYQKFLST